MESKEKKKKKKKPLLLFGSVSARELLFLSLTARGASRELHSTLRRGSPLQGGREGGRERISKEEEDLSHLTNAALHRGTEGRREGDT